MLASARRSWGWCLGRVEVRCDKDNRDTGKFIEPLSSYFFLPSLNFLRTGNWGGDLLVLGSQMTVQEVTHVCAELLYCKPLDLLAKGNVPFKSLLQNFPSCFHSADSLTSHTLTGLLNGRGWCRFVFCVTSQTINWVKLQFSSAIFPPLYNCEISLFWVWGGVSLPSVVSPSETGVRKGPSLHPQN